MNLDRNHVDSQTYQNARRFLTAFGALKAYTIANSMASGVDLHASQLTALHFIFYEPGITQTALAARLHVTTTAVSNSVRDMVAQGLVERRVDPSDARSMQLFLAPNGQAIAERIIDTSTQAYIEILSPLSNEEQQKFVETLEKILLAKHIELDIRKLIYWE